MRRGEISGSVLDIGCGTGENALFFAGEGYEVWGIDSAPLAIQKAREKAAGRGLSVHFLIMNALEIDQAQAEVRYRHRFRALPYPVGRGPPGLRGRPCSRPVPGREIPHALLQRPGAPRIRPEKDHRGRDTGELPGRVDHQLHQADDLREPHPGRRTQAPGSRRYRGPEDHRPDLPLPLPHPGIAVSSSFSFFPLAVVTFKR